MIHGTETENKVYNFLKKKLLDKIDKYDLEGKDSAKPFQYALFTEEGYLVKGFIHGCETALGNWHESIAKIIATDNFKVAKKLQGKDKLCGCVSSRSQEVFSNIISELESVIREPNHEKEAKEIYVVGREGEILQNRKQTIDLYLENLTGEEIYFEIKGPKPNKNEMRAAKRDLLEVYSMRAFEGVKPKIFLGMYYNPYSPDEYSRWTCLKYFEKGGDFLVGRDFWDFLGGQGTFETLIDIYIKVGEEIRPSLEMKLKTLSNKQAF